jgi:hypothetical protein
VDLPLGDTIGNLTNATFEMWVNWNLQGSWSRVFDFGQDTTNNMFLTPRNGNIHTMRFAATTGGFATEQQITITNQLPDGAATHVAVTIDADNQIATLYMNGMPAAIIFNYSFTPSSLGATGNNYLGKSQYADPYFTGSIDEFRIYNRALSASDIAASYAGGPDGTPP